MQYSFGKDVVKKAKITRKDDVDHYENWIRVFWSFENVFERDEINYVGCKIYIMEEKKYNPKGYVYVLSYDDLTRK